MDQQHHHYKEQLPFNNETVSYQYALACVAHSNQVLYIPYTVDYIIHHLEPQEFKKTAVTSLHLRPRRFP